MTSHPASTGTGRKPQGPLPPLLLTLTVVTGVVDAVSILRLGHDRGLLLRAGAAAELVLVAGALALTAGARVRGARGDDSRGTEQNAHMRRRLLVMAPILACVTLAGCSGGAASSASPCCANHKAHGSGREPGPSAGLFL